MFRAQSNSTGHKRVESNIGQDKPAIMSHYHSANKEQEDQMADGYTVPLCSTVVTMNAVVFCTWTPQSQGRLITQPVVYMENTDNIFF